MRARRSIPEFLANLRDGEKPYEEAIHGRKEPKVSPRWTHTFLQTRLALWLYNWANGRGRAGTEWRCYLIEGEEKPSSLVPDVSYISYERLPRDVETDLRERPRMAPDIAIEVFSPSDRKRTLEEKIALYLAHGSRVVMVVYPDHRIVFHTASGATTHPAQGTLVVPGYDDLRLDADALFADL